VKAGGHHVPLADGDDRTVGRSADHAPEVLDAVAVAGRVVAELHARGRELRFGSDPDSGRIVVEVRDLDGNVLREIPPTGVMDILQARTVR
jgi:flagellar protein FlaG